MVDPSFLIQPDFLRSLNFCPWSKINLTRNTPIQRIQDVYNLIFNPNNPQHPSTAARTQHALCFWVIFDFRTNQMFVPSDDPDIIHEQWMEALPLLFPVIDRELAAAINATRAENEDLGMKNMQLQETMSQTTQILRRAKNKIIILRRMTRRLRDQNNSRLRELTSSKLQLLKSEIYRKKAERELMALKRKTQAKKNQKFNPSSPAERRSTK